MKKIALTLLISLLFAGALSADELHLFILSGQSNMEGLNPDTSFTPAVERAFGKENVIVVKDAQRSQPIRRWYKNWKPAKGPMPNNADGALFDRLMQKIEEAVGQKKPTTVTFVWMQGERDTVEKHQDVYEESLKGLVQQLRDDLGCEEIHVVIGRLSDYGSGTEAWDAIRKIQVDLCEANPAWEWVNTDDLNGKKNGVHYTRPGYYELGKRFAEKAVKLLITSKK
jgi:hypothetical protein